MKIKKKKPEKKIINPGVGLSLWTNNTNGMLNEVVIKGKRKEAVNWGCDAKIINNITGEVLTDNLFPRFSHLKYEDYERSFREDKYPIRFLEPMSAVEHKDYVQQPGDVAELKRDGHRALIYITPKGNRAFSRRVSKVTGWYSENTDTIPHIRDIILQDFYGTVLDGELDYGGDSMDVQSVTGSKPENAIQHQFKNGFIPFVVFDILYYKGVNIQALPLWERRIYAAIVVNHIQEVLQMDIVQLSKVYLTEYEFSEMVDLIAEHNSVFDDITTEVSVLLSNSMEITEDYKKLFVNFLNEGREGIMIKDMRAPYEQKKTKSWLKLKGTMTHDVIFMGLSEPTKEYEGKRLEDGTLHEWEYWYWEEEKVMRYTAPGTPETMELWMDAGFEPVSKPFAKGWCGGIRAGIYRPVNSPELEHIVFHEIYGDDYLDQAWDEELLIKVGDMVYHLEEVTTVKGLTEDVMIDLSINADKYAWEKQVLEVKSNGFADKEIGSLRHPRFKQFRDDKGYKQCLWSSYLGEEDE